ncbi:hypothetical protein [Bradyrhizobium sp. sBnM-33]|nr:hypothetical protein [Bradyrhizobium sp. sBnM-33]WOH53985.1 hypothetical protein RX328_18945 [Bradyrhizobium sp. sBnM-33]
MKPKPWLPGRRALPFAIRGAIIIVVGGAVGSAGGTVAVAAVDGGSGNDR